MEHFLKPYAAVAYANPETVQNTYDLACRCLNEGIPGAFVECGVAAGAQLGAMLHAISTAKNGIKLTPVINQKTAGSVDGYPIGGGWNRQVIGFDSFCGIPMAGPRDTVQPGVEGLLVSGRPMSVVPEALLVSSGITSHSMAEVERNLHRWGFGGYSWRLVPGWFQHTLPRSEELIRGGIAILRLDGDLYESTKCCLQNLYGNVVPGGFVIIDDYALDGCREAVHEFLGERQIHVDLIPVNPEEPTVRWFRLPPRSPSC